MYSALRGVLVALLGGVKVVVHGTVGLCWCATIHSSRWEEIPVDSRRAQTVGLCWCAIVHGSWWVEIPVDSRCARNRGVESLCARPVGGVLEILAVYGTVGG